MPQSTASGNVTRHSTKQHVTETVKKQTKKKKVCRRNIPVRFISRAPVLRSFASQQIAGTLLFSPNKTYHHQPGSSLSSVAHSGSRSSSLRPCRGFARYRPSLVASLRFTSPASFAPLKPCVSLVFYHQ